jgi:pimeloyl-ACP methyl ester carboxylesterase
MAFWGVLADNRSVMAVSPQHFTDVDGLRVQFRMHGKADGEPLLLLHGWGGSSLSFMGAASLLEERYRTLAPDLPGFGFSEAPPEAWGSTEYAHAIAGLPRAAGCDAVDVVGHSFGGKVALALAVEYPDLVRRLVIVASPILQLPPEPGVRRASLRFSMLRGASKLLPPLRDRMLDWGRNRFGSADYKSAGVLRPTLVRVVNEDWRPALAAINIPVLLIWGTDDTEVPLRVAEEALAELPDAKLVTLEGAGHFPFLDQPEPFAEAVTSFLG